MTIERACQSPTLKIREWAAAMGAAVGGAMGAAGGATLGLAVASLVMPGIGPVIAFGMVGAALLGLSVRPQVLRLATLLKRNLAKAFHTRMFISTKTPYVTANQS